MLHFLRPKTTLIVANGEKPPIGLLAHYRSHASHVVALDGAALWMLEHKVVPHVVIGDFDSANDLVGDNFEMLYIEDQNSNDLEKALDYCVQHNLSEVTVLGAFGLRADHFLTNLYVLSKFALDITITFTDGCQHAFLCPKDRPVTFTKSLGAFVSLFPLGQNVGPITTTGVEYPLFEEFLSMRTRIGTLNRIVAEYASLSCNSGDLLVVLENRDGAHQLI